MDWGIVAMTVVVCFGYCFAFALFFDVCSDMVYWLRFDEEDPKWTKWVAFLPIVFMSTVMWILHFIHCLLLVWFGYSVVTNFFKSK
jgi:uncharacterized protein involved in cysteine biosynthesis